MEKMRKSRSKLPPKNFFEVLEEEDVLRLYEQCKGDGRRAAEGLSLEEAIVMLARVENCNFDVREASLRHEADFVNFLWDARIALVRLLADSYGISPMLFNRRLRAAYMISS